MFLLSFYISGRVDPICLKYSSFESISKAQQEIESQKNPSWIRLLDDYGSSACFREIDIVSVVAIDVAKEQAGSGEIALINARANAKLNSRAAADPELRAAQHMGQLMGMNRQ